MSTITGKINSFQVLSSSQNMKDDENKTVWKIPSSISNIQNISHTFNKKQPSIQRIHVSEQEIIHELLFSLHGIGGKFIKTDGDGGFKLDPKVEIEQRPVVLMIMELGYLYYKINAFTVKSKKRGLVSQGLVYAIQQEVTKYIHQISMISSQTQAPKNISSSKSADTPLSEEAFPYQNISTSSDNNQFSLAHFENWARPQLQTFQCLYDVLSNCENKSGGELISTVARYIHHGNPELQSCVTYLVSCMTQPFFHFISKWMVEGTLFDPYGEFFVCEDNHLNDSYVWDGKYTLSESKIPEFMSKNTAEQILRTGICIKFLNKICDEKTPLTGTRTILRKMETNGDHLLNMVKPCNQLSTLIENTHSENSKLVLNVLTNKFHLFQHLQGLRNYMLLGKGDFMHCLMNLLVAELDKPACHLHSASLHQILDAAIRETNAQYDDKEVLSKLTIKTLVVSNKDLGWDIFVLDYDLNGPLEQILRVKDSPYNITFKFLWNMKRIENVSSKIWENQIFVTKSIRHIKELAPVLKQGSGLISEIIHFMQQFQYYILFEVVETAWLKFEAQIHQATSLRTVVEEHQHFLNTISEGTMHDDKSKHFKFHLASITSCVLELKNLQESFIMACESESQRRKDLELKIEKFGTNNVEQAKNEKELNKFRNKFIPDMKAQFTSIAKSYQSTLKKFLLDLSIHPNNALKLLSNRLDFNEHYKKSDNELSEVVKFRRASDNNEMLRIINSNSPLRLNSNECL